MNSDSQLSYQTSSTNKEKSSASVAATDSSLPSNNKTSSTQLADRSPEDLTSPSPRPHQKYARSVFGSRRSYAPMKTQAITKTVTAITPSSNSVSIPEPLNSTSDERRKHMNSGSVTLSDHVQNTSKDPISNSSSVAKVPVHVSLSLRPNDPAHPKEINLNDVIKLSDVAEIITAIPKDFNTNEDKSNADSTNASDSLRITGSKSTSGLQNHAQSMESENQIRDEVKIEKHQNEPPRITDSVSVQKPGPVQSSQVMMSKLSNIKSLGNTSVKYPAVQSIMLPKSTVVRIPTTDTSPVLKFPRLKTTTLKVTLPTSTKTTTQGASPTSTAASTVVSATPSSVAVTKAPVVACSKLPKNATHENSVPAFVRVQGPVGTNPNNKYIHVVPINGPISGVFATSPRTSNNKIVFLPNNNSPQQMITTTDVQPLFAKIQSPNSQSSISGIDQATQQTVALKIVNSNTLTADKLSANDTVMNLNVGNVQSLPHQPKKLAQSDEVDFIQILNVSSLSTPNTPTTTAASSFVTATFTNNSRNNNSYTSSSLDTTPIATASLAETVSNQEALTKMFKPIRFSGSARCDGLLPYRRSNTFILSSSTPIVTDFPMIKDYKSLAGDQEVARTTATNVANAVSNLPQPQRRYYHKTLPRWKPSEKQSMSSPVSTVSKPWQLSEKQQHSYPASTVSRTTVIANKDTQQLPTRKPAEKEDKTSSARTTMVKDVHKNSERRLKKKTFIDLTSDDEEAISSQPRTVVLKNDYLSETIEKIRQRTGSSDSSSSEKRSRNRKHSMPNLEEPAFSILDLDPPEPSPVIDTVNSISRTLFALDRLSWQRRYLYANLSQFEECIDHLKMLTQCLQGEREKQKNFMDKNLERWKCLESIQFSKGRMAESFRITPAQRLIDKYSLKIRRPSTLTSPTSQRRIVFKNSIPKSSTPPVISKRTELKMERRRTFQQVLSAYKQRKKEKKIPSPSRLKKTLPKTSTVATVITPIATTSSRTIPKNPTSIAASIQTSLPSSQILSLSLPIMTPTSYTTSFTKTEEKMKEKMSMLLKESTSYETKTTSHSLDYSDDDMSFLPKWTSTRTRHAPRKFSNPKDPYYTSSDDIALQKALALSIKTANEERRRKSSETLPQQQMTLLQESLLSPPTKKKKREVDQLVDTYWNESWLKDTTTGSGRDITSPPGGMSSSYREERALHYAIARFAEMEQKSPSLSPASTPREKQTLMSVIDSAPNSDTKRRVKRKKDDDEEEPKKDVKKKLTKIFFENRTLNRKIRGVKFSQYKGMELLKKAKENVAKAKEKRLETKTASIVLDKLPLNEINRSRKHSKKYQTMSEKRSETTSVGKKKEHVALTPPEPALVQKKEYLLVPKYKGFKDFTPIVVDSRTRRSATAEDRDKLKKHDFALMVVEKVGDQTNEIIVAEGEDKSQKLAEASDKMQKQFELLSKKKRYLSVSRHTGETVLHKAARLGYAEIAEHGIKEGANVQAKDNAGWTALHEACAYGKRNVTEVLLRYGADPNCSSNSGIRPLHDAAEKGNASVIRLLLSYGADPSIGTYSGALPIDCTRNENIKKFLREHEYDQNFLKTEDNKETWQFSGSCDALDTCDVTGIFDDVPLVGNLMKTVEFQMSPRPLPTSYYLPCTNADGTVTGYKNYFILTDILERFSCSRNAFFKHHKVETTVMKLSQLKADIANNMSIGHLPEHLNLNSSPETPGCSKALEEEDIDIEFVTMGHYSLRKLMNFKMCRVDL